MARKEKSMTEWIPSSHLTFHEVGDDQLCFRLKVSKDELVVGDDVLGGY